MSPEPASLAIVTGAAHRLGRAFALALAGRGYALLLHYHTSKGAIEQTARDVQAMGVPAVTVKADLRDADAPQTIFAAVDGGPHPLRVLVNSAAVMPRGDVRTLPVDEWDAVMSLNLRAPFLLAQEAASRMAPGGLIVNISDVGAGKAWSGFPAYAVSKAGLEALTRVLARGLAPEIRVNAIAPGLVLPSDQVDEAQWQRLVARSPLGRPVEPEQIAAALLFLIDNPSITGQILTVDGGFALT